MAKPQVPKEQSGFELHPDNPFIDDWNRLLKSAKSSTRSVSVEDGVTTERMTIVMEKQYLPFGFAKLYQNKEVFRDLSHYACKVLVHMALYMEYEQQLIKLSAKEVGLERRQFSKAILELLLARILVRQKREWYWVNITILVVGRVKQLEH